MVQTLTLLKTTDDGIPIEVTVVDNASDDGSPEMIRERFSDVRLIANSRNLGFARAVNQGLAVATGEYYLLLNSDTLLPKIFLGPLVRLLSDAPDVGMVAPRLLNSDGSDQGTARNLPTPAAYLFGRKSPITRLWPGNPFSRRYLVGRHHAGQEPFDVNYVSGACLLVRAVAVRQVGPLDERFFMYCEDTDWCRRFTTAGWRICCIPSVEVIHLEGASSESQRARLIVVFHRSIYRYYCKHHARGRRSLMLIAMVALAFRASVLLLVHALRRGVRKPLSHSGAEGDAR